MDDNPSDVICVECGEVTGLTILDFGFGDDFGGVSDYQCVTKCCESSEWLKGCSACDKIKPLVKRSENVNGRSVDFWYCSECLKELKAEEEPVPKICRTCGECNAPDSLKCDECGYDL
jgi:hypothetical protein